MLRPLIAALMMPAAIAFAADPPADFTRMVAHWDAYADDAYLPFIDEARPQLVQVGFYGAHFWSLGHSEDGKGYPAHLPVVGLEPCGRWFENLNGELRRRGAKVVGHFNVEFLIGEPEGPAGPRGFFKFYRELWDENVLGARPTDDPLTLLQRNADGSPMIHTNYNVGGMREYWACLLNPHWRAVLKAWVSAAVRRGVDGLIANYFYRHNCLCEHCVGQFKQYLAERFAAAELRERFGIDDLAAHKFTEIVGWHDPKESTPLRREMLRFSQIATKLAFDEVFIEHGRSLKNDLIVAQWNHLGDFSQIGGDERCMLPAELWGRGEDYLWYSTGGSANFTDLAQGFLGEGTLQARYIRGAFDDKPFTLGKYEMTRIRVTIAELAANGGMPMGFYTRFTDPAARQEIARYYDFLRRHESLYADNRPAGEALLLFPRSAIHEGNLAPLDVFKTLGRQLLDRHVLFDVCPDDIATAEKRAAYRVTIDPRQSEMFDEKALSELSRIDAPATVRVSITRPASGEGRTLHLVNYNRREPAEPRSPGTGIADENPIAAEAGMKVDLLLPSGVSPERVLFVSPEEPEPRELPFEASDGRLRLQLPQFLVYGVVNITMSR